jgi:hypothetical protein
MVIQAEDAARHTRCCVHSSACLSQPRNAAKISRFTALQTHYCVFESWFASIQKGMDERIMESLVLDRGMSMEGAKGMDLHELPVSSMSLH